MMRIPAVFIAAALIGLGSVIEETGRPGAVAASHLFYGWGSSGRSALDGGWERSDDAH
jgi:hypothetical protein